MSKNYRMTAETGSYKLTGQNVKLIHTVTTTAVKRNWIWLSIYIIVTLGGIVGSYFTNEWISVGLSVAIAAITFFVGLRMIQEVITITKEIR